MFYSGIVKSVAFLHVPRALHALARMYSIANNDTNAREMYQPGHICVGCVFVSQLVDAINQKG